VQLCLFLTLLFIVKGHYMFRPNWPSSGVQVALALRFLQGNCSCSSLLVNELHMLPIGLFLSELIFLLVINNFCHRCCSLIGSSLSLSRKVDTYAGFEVILNPEWLSTYNLLKEELGNIVPTSPFACFINPNFPASRKYRPLWFIPPFFWAYPISFYCFPALSSALAVCSQWH
jgi:hypothetical protein